MPFTRGNDGFRVCLRIGSLSHSLAMISGLDPLSQLRTLLLGSKETQTVTSG